MVPVVGVSSIELLDAALGAADLVLGYDARATVCRDWPFVCLDGTLVPIAQLHGPKNPSGHDAWYSGKHHRHGGNAQTSRYFRNRP